jgi:uncharacterized protein (DUF305 family)
MVNTFDNVFNNLNQIFMAGFMTSPMVLIELVLMRDMYRNTRANAAIIGLSIVALVGFFALIRAQTAIGDTQFLRSMIPHHAGAILMCERASIEAPELKDLCKSIVSSQETEIRQMKAFLEK